MTLYFFDMRDGAKLFVDEEGVELPDLKAVQIEAARSLGGMPAARNRSATSCQTPRISDAKDLRPAHWELGIRFFRLSFDPASNAG